MNFTPLIFSANKAPLIREDSDAMWRRLLIIEFPNQFMGNKDDKHHIEKLTTAEELSGLLNLALEGLKRLREKGSFSHISSMKDTRREYLIKSNPAPVFIEEGCEIDPESWVSKEDFIRLSSVSVKKMMRRQYPRKLSVRG